MSYSIKLFLTGEDAPYYAGATVPLTTRAENARIFYSRREVNNWLIDAGYVCYSKAAKMGFVLSPNLTKFVVFETYLN